MLFSPVLLWRPGKKPRPSPVQAGVEISNRHQSQKTRLPNQYSNSPPSSSQPHPLPAATSSTCKDRREIDAGVGRLITEKLSGKKSPLSVKTTNLTDALPPKESVSVSVCQLLVAVYNNILCI